MELKYYGNVYVYSVQKKKININSLKKYLHANYRLQL